MRGWTGFLPVAGRVILGSALLLSAFLSVLALTRRARRRPRREALPSREGVASLAALVAQAARRAYARDKLAERLRALARDAAALAHGVDEAKARALVDEASFPPGREASLFLATDFMAKTDAGGEAFLRGLEASLDAIEGADTVHDTTDKEQRGE
jgi:hypothetical protein